MRTDRPAASFDYGTKIVHIYNDGTREEEPSRAVASRPRAKVHIRMNVLRIEAEAHNESPAGPTKASPRSRHRIDN